MAISYGRMITGIGRFALFREEISKTDPLEDPALAENKTEKTF